tara:strand:+ start:359757 stop:362522 length:2766 start_codon:yes stop_codon:yes gene_type:complete
MTTIFFVFVGLFIGGVLAEEEGMIVGLFIGLAFGMITTLKGRIFQLEQDLAQTMKLVNKTRTSEDIRAKAPEPESKKNSGKTVENTTLSEQLLFAKKAIVGPSSDDTQTSLNKPTSRTETKKLATDWNSATWQQSGKKTSNEPDFAQKVFFVVRDFFTKGNVVVKVGAIILFFGVAFLLKYAADRSMLPIELRLMGVVAVSVVMLFVGWRLRAERLEYGLVLQGAGIGLLYLTVFAASKLYQLIPTSFSFGLMLILVTLSGLLAVKQNAKSLALFGATGGFLAPILMSTGSGSHITLFSYYALLNVGIFAIAWFKSWRVLNLVGFFFTFAISAAWGYKAYLPEHFVSTELFLILFYVFYLIIPILFAIKQAPKLKGYVDGTLVFGLPLIAFALQSGLVDQFEYGQAITAGIMAVIYLSLAKALWLPEKDGFRLLAESYLALGVTFASLAVPLALDGRWTAAVWSLEGAGLVWVGLRQSHFVPRLMGVILSVGAGLAFIESTYRHLPESMPLLNSAYIGMVLVSLSAFFISYLYHKYQQRTYSLEFKLTVVMIIWGLLWWFYAGIAEIDRFVAHHYELKTSLLFIALSTFIQIVISHKCNWSKISLSAFLFMPATALILLVEFVFYNHVNPMAYLGYIAWSLALFVHLLILRRKQDIWPKWMLTTWHAVGVMFIALIVTWAVENWVDSVQILSATWVISTGGLMLTLVAWSLMRWGNRLTWPVQQFPRAYYSLGLLPIMLALVAWQFFAAAKAGIPSPLNYIPLLNPLDLTQGLAAAVLVYWLWFINKFVENKWLSISPIFIASVTALMGFAWINIVIARSVHVFGDVNYSDYAMLNSSLYQASTSIVWSIIAMVLMLVAYKKASRYFWFAGAGLLAIVVAKLFFVDLADSGSISRIVSFLAVGGLMLVIGYLSPLPPKIST